MGTTSSFFGGGGGGGDPQANFQAGSNVANGDLVSLKANGTIEPVTSVANAADFTKSDNGTKIVDDGSPNYSQTSKWSIYNTTIDKYFFACKRDSGAYNDLYLGTYNDSTEEYSLTFRGQIGSTYANMMARKFSVSEGILYAYVKSNGYLYLRGFYWDGSTYSIGIDTYAGSNSISTSSVYINPNGEGSSSLATGAITNSYVSITHATWDGTSSAPTVSHDLDNTSSGRKWTAGGTSWSSNSLVGRHVKGDVHVFAADEANSLTLFACEVNSSSTTYGAKNQLGIPVGSAYKSVEYDTDTNMGVVSYYTNTGVTNALAFSVDTNTLAVTTYPLSGISFSGASAAVGYSPTAKLWQVMRGSSPGEVYYFTLASDGTQGTVNSSNLHPSASIQPEHGSLSPKTGTNSMIVLFNSGNNPTSNYVNTANHTYITQYDLPFVETNIDTHFGEAKEAISSGSVGPVAISNRSNDISGSSFQKGQKLFANPSGTALATSGTYRVGYASDADTVIVTGDPS
jgi:hypothetical protein